jgi:hypothetical protein
VSSEGNLIPSIYVTFYQVGTVYDSVLRRVKNGTSNTWEQFENRIKTLSMITGKLRNMRAACVRKKSFRNYQ